MFANNVTKFLLNMVKDGSVWLNLDDEIISGTMVLHAGQVTHPRIKDLLK
jgi:NAD(P) transhydrogenase subunit alpha